ncbi:MAG TPA: molybdopterin-dependent oxidoreductase [Candidatus Saccharimonadales bacterium]|nr:molybdopterin-dependent oxidoreductase [Candidatus Saccharimonadales bacterium]
MGRIAADGRSGTGLLVGGLAMVFALLVAYLASLIGFTFAPDALAQSVIEVLPGAIAVPLIELLQFWAKRLLVAGVLVAFLACGAIAGALAADPRRRDRVVVAVGLAPWVVTIVLSQLFAGNKVDLPSILLTGSVGAVAFLLALHFLASAAAYQPLEARTGEASPSRRRALLGTAALAAVVAVASVGFGSTVRASLRKTESIRQAVRRLRPGSQAVVPTAGPGFDAIASLSPRITENASFYTIDTTLIKPMVDGAKWRLDVTGAVDAPFSLTYDELLDLEAVEQLKTLECISNNVGGDLMSTALFTGVPLRDLLQRAAPKSGAFKVKLTSVDGYTDSIRIEKALEPDTVVAYLMNGYALPEDHGYPARLLVPNIYGMKNVKWLRSIEVLPTDYLGYWMQRGWSDSAVINTNTRIDTAANLRTSGGVASIAGVAFAGARGIRSVEVSTDGGGSWQPATLETPLGPLTWVRWKLEWTPPRSGKFKVLARATDGTGAVETRVRREPYPSGATGYETREISVQPG